MRIQLSDHFTYKKLFIFVLPSIIMMVFTSIYSIVDGLFVSNYSGEEAVTAINLIYPLFMIFGSIGFMVGAGGSALVSKTLGEGNKELANKYFSMLVYVTLGIGVVIAVAGQFAVEPVAKFLGATDEKIMTTAFYTEEYFLQHSLFSYFKTFSKAFSSRRKNPDSGLWQRLLLGY